MSRHVAYVCPQCMWTLDTDEKRKGLEGENAVLIGILRDALAVIETIVPENEDEADRLYDMRVAIHTAIDPYRHKGTLL